MDTIHEVKLDARPLRRDDRYAPIISLACGYRSHEPQYGVIISANDITLENRRSDEKFSFIDELEIGGRRALVTRLYETACHVSVEVRPGMIDFQIGYSKIDRTFPTVESACAQAITLATALSPYFPDHL